MLSFSPLGRHLVGTSSVRTPFVKGLRKGSGLRRVPEKVEAGVNSLSGASQVVPVPRYHLTEDCQTGRAFGAFLKGIQGRERLVHALKQPLKRLNSSRIAPWLHV